MKDPKVTLPYGPNEPFKAIRMAIVGLAILIAGTLTPAVTLAQAWPTKPITIVAPFSPGGSVDILARMIGGEMSKTFGQPFLVVNRVGAGGTVGAASVASAPGDGYTLLLCTLPDSASRSLYKGLTYDFATDFRPIALLATNPSVLIVHKDVPAKTLAELIAYLKANPTTAAYGSGGVGSAPHLATELFLRRANVKALHVSYQGIPPMMVDLMAGNITFAISSTNVAAPLLQDGRLRPLAISSTTRDAAFPDLPTFAEAAGVDFDFTTWYGLCAPKGTPDAVVNRLHAAAVAALSVDSVQASYKKAGITPSTITSDEFQKLIASEVIKWDNVIKSLGITAK